jgi:hypothetical protein
MKKDKATADNRRIWLRAFGAPLKFPFGRTSDTPGTLDEIMGEQGII